ncbi:MAG: hypothetical protein CL912_32200 [Deltaproteobacteria bacterium]|nr:hypothetical protein [Deltaproteobacteria bacterium]
MSRRLEDDMSGRKERIFGIWRLSLGTKGRFEIGSDGPEVAYRTVIEQAIVGFQFSNYLLKV